MYLAKALGRTLVLPPFIEYAGRSIKLVPFDAVFDLDALRRYLPDAMTMSEFIAVADELGFDRNDATAYCYGRPDEPRECLMQHPEAGSPRSPFWKQLGFTFTRSENHVLSTRVHPLLVQQWQARYPVEQHPFLFLSGPPAPYPVDIKHCAPLQEYVVFNTAIVEATKYELESLFDGRPFVGVHARIGSDWERVCRDMDGKTGMYMSARQCLGMNDPLPKRVCYPTAKRMVKDVFRLIRQRQGAITDVFVAADVRVSSLVRELETKLNKKRDKHNRDHPERAIEKPIRVKHAKKRSYQIDMAALQLADEFIGNCVSSFTHFIARTPGVRANYFGMK
eukprot:TRINITY_DN85565_c0_g1_i1.p2 TRINITY_DN85565_c0_g1~~TRINITY_DN85565_c0_g1_i1.p2  ORF type:complete len:336 (+),score=134.29 TRINITY_DN85565_c0_g1_i1:202-1209(+)